MHKSALIPVRNALADLLTIQIGPRTLLVPLRAVHQVSSQLYPLPACRLCLAECIAMNGVCVLQLEAASHNLSLPLMPLPCHTCRP